MRSTLADRVFDVIGEVLPLNDVNLPEKSRALKKEIADLGYRLGSKKRIVRTAERDLLLKSKDVPPHASHCPAVFPAFDFKQGNGPSTSVTWSCDPNHCLV
jgi:hypothetical protein